MPVSALVAPKAAPVSPIRPDLPQVGHVQVEAMGSRNPLKAFSFPTSSASVVVGRDGAPGTSVSAENWFGQGRPGAVAYYILDDVTKSTGPIQQAQADIYGKVMDARKDLAPFEVHGDIYPYLVPNTAQINLSTGPLGTDYHEYTVPMSKAPNSVKDIVAATKALTKFVVKTETPSDSHGWIDLG